MRQKRKVRPNPAHKPSAAVSTNRVRAVLVIDDIPLRKRALNAYRSAESDFAKTQTQLEIFETSDKPAYFRWEARVLGAELTALREIEDAIRTKARILDAVDEEMFWSGCSRTTAYRRVMANENRPPPGRGNDADEGDQNEESSGHGADGLPKLFGDSNLPPDFDIREYDSLSARQKREVIKEYKTLAKAFHMMTGLPAPDFETELARARAEAGIPDPKEGKKPQSKPSPSKSQVADPTQSHIKSLYRDLARKLHPDYNTNLGWRERELWHEVQDAYAAKDLDRLQGIAARVEVARHGANLTMPVSLLARMAEDLRQKLISLRFMLRSAKKHPAWQFSKIGSRIRDLERQHRREIAAKRKSAEAELYHLTAELDKLATKANKPKNKPRAKAQSNASGFVQDEPFNSKP